MPLKIMVINLSRHESKEFVFTVFYIPSLNQRNTEIYVCVKCKLHLFEGLKANMLIGNNVFYINGFIIKLAIAFAYILSRGVIINVRTRNHLQFLKLNVLANTTTFIPSKSKALVGF